MSTLFVVLRTESAGALECALIFARKLAHFSLFSLPFVVEVEGRTSLTFVWRFQRPVTFSADKVGVLPILFLKTKLLRK